MKSTTYKLAEAEATKIAAEQKIDVPIYRIYKSGKYTLYKPDSFDRHGMATKYSVHNIIAGPK